MTIDEAAKMCFQKYINFSGRATRPEFWKFVLFIFLVSIGLTILNSMIFGPTYVETIRISVNLAGEQSQEVFREKKYNAGWFGTIFSLAIFIPLVAASWRRLHDTGRSGLFVFLPIAGLAATYLIFFLTSQNVPIDTSALPEGTQMPGSLPVPNSSFPFFAGFLFTFGTLITLIVLLARRSQSGPNAYGPNPNEATS
ncbi:MAG: uncharacterized membrane protein YhaH (DUF805 family) [Halocynthiibacter sp.]|jgi:uncharacterized membrane protein YhaH (DUF805 family)